MNSKRQGNQENINFSLKKRRVQKKASKYEKDMFLDEFGYEKYYYRIKNLRKGF